MGMRISEGISTERFGRVFGMGPAKLVPGTLCRRIASGDVILDGYAIQPSIQGMDFVDLILANIALELDNFHWPASNVWP